MNSFKMLPLVMIFFSCLAFAETKTVLVNADGDSQVMGCEYCPKGNATCRRCANAAELPKFFIPAQFEQDHGTLKSLTTRRPVFSSCTAATETGCAEGSSCLPATSYYFACFKN